MLFSQSAQLRFPFRPVGCCASAIRDSLRRGRLRGL